MSGEGNAVSAVGEKKKGKVLKNADWKCRGRLGMFLLWEN